VALGLYERMVKVPNTPDGLVVEVEANAELLLPPQVARRDQVKLRTESKLTASFIKVPDRGWGGYVRSEVRMRLGIDNKPWVRGITEEGLSVGWFVDEASVQVWEGISDTSTALLTQSRPCTRHFAPSLADFPQADHNIRQTLEKYRRAPGPILSSPEVLSTKEIRAISESGASVQDTASQERETRVGLGGIHAPGGAGLDATLEQAKRRGHEKMWGGSKKLTAEEVETVQLAYKVRADGVQRMVGAKAHLARSYDGGKWTDRELGDAVKALTEGGGASKVLALNGLLPGLDLAVQGVVDYCSCAQDWSMLLQAEAQFLMLKENVTIGEPKGLGGIFRDAASKVLEPVKARLKYDPRSG
jgi:hypothetical protein